MLLRILIAGSTLLASHNLPAEETPAAKGSAEYPQTDASPIPQPPLAVRAGSGTADNERVTDVATRDEQNLSLHQECTSPDQLQREVQRLPVATATGQQILVQVQLLEVSLTKLKEAEIDTGWFTSGYLGGAKMRQILDAADKRADGLVAERVTKTQFDDSLRFVAWLKQQNLAKVLSTATLVTVNNRPVSFNVGGEFPIPTNKSSKTAVEFRKLGTQLRVLASARGDDLVQLEVNTRVSAVDYQHAIEISGTNIPGLKVREYNTALELSSGQTAILTGLVEQRIEAEQVDAGRIEELVVDVGLMVVVTPELAVAHNTSSTSANRDILPTNRK